MQRSKRFITGLVSFLCVAVTLGCAHGRVVEPAPSMPPTEEAVAVVVLRLLNERIFDHATELPICIGEPVRGVTSGNVVKRLAPVDARLRDGVACNRSSWPVPSRGVIQVQIRSITTTDDGNLVIRAGYWCGWECADQSAYTLAVVDGQWSILYETFEWIS